MKKFLLVCTVALALAGCAQLQTFQDVVTGATASIQNPVTKKNLQQIEVAVEAAVAGLVQYRRACIRGDIPRSCRNVIVQLQVYTRKIPPVLKNLRTFVKNNDQVNAVVAYNTIKQLLADFKTTATAAGVQ